jgi:hypothetical protein
VLTQPLKHDIYNPSNTIVARTAGYTYAAEVWASSLVQGPFSVAPSQTKPPVVPFRFASNKSLHIHALRYLSVAWVG